MTNGLDERLLVIPGAIESLMWMLSDAEACALPGTTKEGLLRARFLMTKMQAWVIGQREKLRVRDNAMTFEKRESV